MSARNVRDLPIVSREYGVNSLDRLNIKDLYEAGVVLLFAGWFVFNNSNFGDHLLLLSLCCFAIFF